MSTYLIACTWDGGASGHFRNLATKLAERGHRVVFLAEQGRDLGNPNANPAVLTWPSRQPTHLVDAAWFNNLLSREQPRGFVASWRATNIMLLVGAARRVPVRVAWYHTVTKANALDRGSRTWRSRLLVMRKRIVYRAATHFATASRAAASDLAASYGIRATRITTLGLSIADPGVPRCDPNPLQVVCVGRMYPTKGQDILIRALALLPENVRLVLVGDGPSRADYARLAMTMGVSHRCDFVGKVPRKEVPAWLAQAAVAVVPSREEAFGLVNVESLAVGTPVVASRVGGIPEIVRDGQEGFLVPPEDPAALSRAIYRLLENPEFRRRISANARRRFLEQFEPGQVIKRQADWLESLV